MVNVPCMTLYKQFMEWCETAGYMKKMNLFSFKEEVSKTYDVYIDSLGSEGPDKNKLVFKRRGEFDGEWKPF